MFASVSVILYKVTPLLTLACRMVKGFAKPVRGLDIKKERYKAVIAYKGKARPS